MSFQPPEFVHKKKALARVEYRGDADYTFVKAAYEPGGFFAWRQPAYQLVVLLQGRADITLEGNLVVLREGEGILIHPSWEVHYVFSQDMQSIHTGCQLDSSCLNPEEHRLLEAVHGAHQVPAAVHILIGEGLNAPITAGRQLHDAQKIMAKACLLRFAASVAEGPSDGRPQHPALLRALQCLEAEPTKFNTANELAKQCGMSVSRLRQIFREAGYESPSAMIWRIKTEYAAQMVRSTSLTLGEIADRSGFTNPFHLSRSVKKHTGLSPREMSRKKI